MIGLPEPIFAGSRRAHTTFIGLSPTQKAADARLAPLPFCEHLKCYCRDVTDVNRQNLPHDRLQYSPAEL
jgi:hypothetical protein